MRIIINPTAIKRRMEIVIMVLAAFTLAILMFSLTGGGEQQPAGRITKRPIRPTLPPTTTTALRDDDDEGEDYSYAADEADDSESSFFLRVERAHVAPLELIGSLPRLVPGAILKSMGKSSSSFPPGSLVLMTQVQGSEFYQGFIINSPLPADEQARAQQALRLSDSATPLNLSHQVLFYGYGGPVHSNDEHEHRWEIIHDNTRAKGALMLPGSSVAVGGADSVLDVTTTRTRMIVVYGAAVWLPGQLEREITRDGLWEVLPRPISSFDDILAICGA